MTGPSQSPSPPAAEASSSRRASGSREPSPSAPARDNEGSLFNTDPFGTGNANPFGGGNADPFNTGNVEPFNVGGGLQENVTFKRRSRNLSVTNFTLPKIFTTPGSGNRPSTSFTRPSSSRAEHQRKRSVAFPTDLPNPIFAHQQVDTPEGPEQTEDVKDPAGVDWYVEGPGKRVGYEDLTAIDWIFEYAKERQRQRLLYSGASGALVHLKQIADASQVWLVLILTGLSSGLVAAFIDVATDWLGDLKTGYCSNEGGDGKFYLNKVFCCWGYDELAKCADWHAWSGSVSSKGGSYLVEYFFYVLFSVLFAVCACILVKNHAIYAKHSGIPEIKTVLGGFVIRYFLGAWTLVIKSLGLCLSVASGLWVGKEGPLVHVACCFANLFMKFFTSINENEARKREVLSAAAAAGISVAFGAPVGGVLFSLETLSYYFPDKTMWQSFVCAMLGAVALHWFDPFRTNKLVMYNVTFHSSWHGFEMVPYALLGILGGIYGGLLIKLNLKIAARRRDNPIFQGPTREVFVISLLTALVNFPIKFMRAQATELLYFLFAECRDLPDDQLGLCKSGKANTGVIALLLVSAILGFLLATLSFGLLLPAGILLPSMAIGALYGRAVGLIMRVLHLARKEAFPFSACEPDVPCITPGTYAIIGAASAIGGATRMTVSIVVIMFELTGALTYVLPIMIAVMISKWVGDAISPRGIYEAWIHFNGYPFLDNRDDEASSTPDVPASQVMTRIEDLVVITATGHTIQSLRTLLAQHSYRGFPIIDNPRDALLLGYISRIELAYALSTATAMPRNLPLETEAYFSHQPMSDPTTSLDLRPWMDQTPITLNARASLQLSVNMFSRLGLRYILYVEKGCLRGLLTKKDIWFIMNGSEGELRETRSAMRHERLSIDERGLLGGDEHDDRGRSGRPE